LFGLGSGGGEGEGLGIGSEEGVETGDAHCSLPLLGLRKEGDQKFGKGKAVEMVGAEEKEENMRSQVRFRECGGLAVA